MGFTVSDMMITSADKYDLKMIGGAGGWANSISWLLMVEDMTIIRNFAGKELAVTTGLGFDSTEKLLALVKLLDEKHCAGLIINTGCYVMEVPEEVIAFCNEHDLPLMTSPWNVTMSEMIKDLTVRIFLQSQTDEQISAAFIKAIESPALTEEYRETLSANFDFDGKFQVVAFSTDDLDSMDSVDRKRIGYRLQIYLANISHNAHFFYFDGCFLLILNALDEKTSEDIIEGFLTRTKRRMPEKQVYLGIGSSVNGAAMVHVSYKRAVYSVQQTKKRKIEKCSFDELGIASLLYSISDPLVKGELIEKRLRPLIEYDQAHDSGLVQTLKAYLKVNGSVKKVSEELFIHKNTIVYRINKIKDLLKCDLDDGEERIYLYLACLAME